MNRPERPAPPSFPSAHAPRPGRVGLAPIVATAILFAGCQPGDSADEAGDGTAVEAPASAVAEPFPDIPADGPFAPPAPPPDDYRPTAASAPSTDIWLEDPSTRRGRRRGRGTRERHRPGRLRQSARLLSGRSVALTTSLSWTPRRPRSSAMTSTSGTTEQVTHTPNGSEFSPTFVPGQDAFTVTYEAAGIQHCGATPPTARDGAGLLHCLARGIPCVGECGVGRDASSSAIQRLSRWGTR